MCRFGVRQVMRCEARFIRVAILTQYGEIGFFRVVSRAWHEGALSGNGPNFAKLTICALLPVEFNATSGCL